MSSVVSGFSECCVGDLPEEAVDVILDAVGPQADVPLVSCRVRWKTAEQDRQRSFRNAGRPMSSVVFRAGLLAAARMGEAFNMATGELVSWPCDEPGTSWYRVRVHLRRYGYTKLTAATCWHLRGG